MNVDAPSWSSRRTSFRAAQLNLESISYDGALASGGGELT